MANNFEVSVGGNVAGLQRALGVGGQADKALDHVADKAEKTASSVAGSFNKINTASTGASRALAASAMQAAKSGRDYTALSRVVQDLPFGFIGIQNNITQLLPAAGALGLVFSAVVSAITFAQVGTSAWTRGLKENKTAVDNLTKSGEEYAKSLGNISGARLRGLQGSAEEVTTLRLLYKQYTDNTNSLQERKSAYDQLQNLYPGYFGNLKFEETATKKTRDAYDSLTQSIIATAKARAFSEQIAGNAIKRQENELKILQLRITGEQFVAAEVARSEKNQRSLNASYTDAQKGLRLSEEQILKNNAAVSEQVKQSSVYLGLQSKIVTYEKENLNLSTNDLKLEKEINKELEKGAKLTGKVGEKDDPAKKTGLTKAQKAELEYQKRLLEYQKQGLAFAGSLELLKISNSVSSELQKQSDAIKEFNDAVSDTEKLSTGLEARDQAFRDSLEKMNSYSEGITRILNQGVENGVSDLAGSLGEALGKGENVVEAFGNSVLSTVGGILVQFGKLTIATGVASLGLKAALKLGNPFAAIAAGAALVAAGAAVSGFGSKIGSDSDNSSGSSTGRGRRIPGFATGVNNFSGGLALVGERGPEVVNLPSGSDVIPNHRIGGYGNAGANFEVVNMFDNDQFVTIIQRRSDRLRRAGVR